MIAAAGSENSAQRRIAASRSSRLLYDSSLPCSTSARASDGPRRLDGVEGRLLVRVLAVAERARQRPGDHQRLGKVGQRRLRRRHPPEVRGDRPVVGGGVGERLPGQPEPGRRRDLTLGVDLGQHRRVVGRIDDHRHPLVVLGRGADHRRTADVDVLDDLVERRAARDRLAERIEVHDDQIDRVEAGLLHLGPVLGRRPPQDPAVDARVQRLHPPVEDLGRAGEVAHLAHRNPRLAERARRAARRQDLESGAGEPAREVDHARLVRDRDQRPRNLRQLRACHERVSITSRPSEGELRLWKAGAEPGRTRIPYPPPPRRPLRAPRACADRRPRPSSDRAIRPSSTPRTTARRGARARSSAPSGESDRRPP